jgi:uncharacterized membrane protein YhaH (DUF805 family)
MDWRWLLFSFRGRINRAKYWLTCLIYLIAGVLLALILGAFDIALGQGAIVQLLGGVLELVLTVSGLAVATKRLHDRDRSAWWLLMFYVLPPALVGIGLSVAWLSGGLMNGGLTGTGMAFLIITCMIAMAIGFGVSSRSAACAAPSGTIDMDRIRSNHCRRQPRQRAGSLPDNARR